MIDSYTPAYYTFSPSLLVYHFQHNYYEHPQAQAKSITTARFPPACYHQEAQPQDRKDPREIAHDRSIRKVHQGRGD